MGWANVKTIMILFPLTHLLLSALVAGALDAGLALLFALEQGLILIVLVVAAGAAVVEGT